MWALLKPLVGLDPKTANLFEQPLLKGRMQALLGDNYSTAVSLLNTADKIQQEGPLFYLVSNYTPVPQLAEKAGFVWNAETNQMAVLLVSGGAPLIFAEQLNQQAAKVIPSWPAELVDYTDPVKLKQMAISKAATTAGSQLGLSENQAALVNAAATGGDVKTLATTQVSTAATEKISQSLSLSEQQTALMKTAASGGDVKALAATQASNAATEQVSGRLGLSENQSALVKTAATGGDVKALAVTQASNAATAQVSERFALSESQNELVKTAVTGGDAKALAITQATEAAIAKATALASEKAAGDLGLSKEQTEAASQLAQGRSMQELAGEYQQQGATGQIKALKEQLVSDATASAAQQLSTAPVQSQVDSSIEALTVQLSSATELEMAAEMALEQATDRVSAAERQLAQATTGASQDAANAALVRAQTEYQAASENLSKRQRKVQQLQQQIKAMHKDNTTGQP